MTAPASRKRRGFSLLEIVAAIALAGGGLVAVAAILPSVIASLRTASERAEAWRVLSRAEGHWAEIPFATWSAQVDAGATRILARDGHEWTVSEPLADRAYAATLSKDSTLSTTGVVVYRVILRWPVVAPDGVQDASPSQQSTLTATGARWR